MLANQIISTGLQCLGTPYVFNAPSFQTDSFVGVPISFDQIKKGDLLFFTTRERKNRQGLSRMGHVAIYIGQDQMFHTYRQGKKVLISELNSYWKKSFIGAKRVL
ncbi:C40 family peptidase [Bacillus sp. ISL-18]|uniref:C40 family peptidase n=1 Tax=Bacillus sp. ISL-18 TaxID=2819118 RepID=UPI001BE4FE52|nr:NlpC/P60 family protein [Bacillus sp. ISL-18]MBT2658400.1 C40 family peptidase [Bacillus sp. ISL-18]